MHIHSSGGSGVYSSAISCIAVLLLCLCNPHLAVAGISFKKSNLGDRLPRGASFGLSVGDADGDGRPDLFFSNHGAVPQFFINRYPEWVELTLNGIVGDNHGAVIGDLNRDGYADIVVLNGGGSGVGADANQLMLGGAGGWMAVPGALGLSLPEGRGRSPVLLDANGDGLLDVFVTNSVRPDNRGQTTLFLQRDGLFEPQESWPSQGNGIAFGLLAPRVDGDQELLVATWPLARISASVGLQYQNLLSSGSVPWVNDAVSGDFDGDLDDDLFVVTSKTNTNARRLNDGRVQIVFETGPAVQTFFVPGSESAEFSFGPSWQTNQFFKIGATGTPVGAKNITLDPLSQEAQGVPEPVGAPSGVYVGYDAALSGWWVRSIGGSYHGTAVGIRSAGVLGDPAAVDFLLSPNGLKDAILLRGDDDSFTHGLGLAEVDSTSCLSAVGGDFDNDGDLDLYLACNDVSHNLPNIVLENDGAGRMTQVLVHGAEGDAVGLADAVVMTELNGDGFLDLVVTNGRRDHAFLWERTEVFLGVPNGNHWIQIRLEGSDSNPSGIGARLIVEADGRRFFRFQNGGAHRFSQNDQVLHVGIGAAESIESIEVTWPSGRVQRFGNVQVDQLLVLKEPTESSPPIRRVPLGQTVLLAALLVGVGVHRRRRACAT